MIMNMGLRKGSFKKETEALKANIVMVSLSQSFSIRGKVTVSYNLHTGLRGTPYGRGSQWG